MKKAILAATASMIPGMIAQAHAQSSGPDYRDDRSDAAAIVRSFYNAINRREYSRAWSYFGETKPSADFEGFAKGYGNTREVRVVMGDASVEGTAGSTFFNLPVAILAIAADGGEKVFAGCYTARLANPQIQEPPFAGLHIERAELTPTDQAVADALPARCGAGPPAPAKDSAFEQAKAAFAASHGGQCASMSSNAEQEAPNPDLYTIKFQRTDDPDGKEQEARLFRFFCSAGAYNEDHVYYLSDTVEGVREIHFAAPELDIHYENGDSAGKVEAINIVGFRSEGRLVNSFYDDATQTISSNGKWRGVGDASSGGTWLFRNGAFSLVQYDVDASYDGEINPETILDYNTAP